MNSTFSKLVLNKIKDRQLPAESGIFLALILLALSFTILSPYFFTSANFSNILIQSAITIVVASGATLVIASGGIDLSVGSILCLSGIFMAMGIKADIPAWLSILLGLGGGTLMGVINGFMIGVVKITPLIATLASLSVYRAIAYIITDARPIYGFPMSLRIFGTGYIGPFPYAFLLALLVVVMRLAAGQVTVIMILVYDHYRRCAIDHRPAPLARQDGLGVPVGPFHQAYPDRSAAACGPESELVEIVLRSLQVGLQHDADVGPPCITRAREHLAKELERQVLLLVLLHVDVDESADLAGRVENGP